MDFLRNKKLVKKMPDGRIFEASIKVDFDKNRHLSDENIHKRYVERERLKELEKQKISEEYRKREKEDENKMNAEKEHVDHRSQKEGKHRRKRNQEERLKKERLNEMIVKEERKLLIAQRKLESRRLLSALFWRIEVANLREKNSRLEMSSRDLEENLQAELETKLRQALLREQEQRLRKRVWFSIPEFTIPEKKFSHMQARRLETLPTEEENSLARSIHIVNSLKSFTLPWTPDERDLTPDYLIVLGMGL
ncbi:unnamed protein product [Onchocerca flexuosa]|uniref:Trichohyalin-like n=1 Tax=Onchocerca flexuosa TaxID=387005 RepID=A0A183H7A2_9BILA|nr:unnamed protein product [Onchocerca flexuosa]